MRFAFLLLALFAAGARAETDAFEFHAQKYVKDNAANTLVLTGSAWIRRGDRYVWADAIEIDYNTNRAIANGNVHIRENGMEGWCRHASYNLKGEDAVLDEATITMNQIVITGTVVRRIDMKHFELENGSYSNCNLEAAASKDIANCSLDWKLSGRKFRITFGEYATVDDALFYVKDIPLFYSPLFFFPLKTQRQSGFLWPRLIYSSNLGTAMTPPYYLVLGPWHDLTVYPSYFSDTGYHLGLEYRYIYSGDKKGTVNLYFIQRRFSDNIANPTIPTGLPKRFLGLAGEAAVNATNYYSLGGRAHSNQYLRLVSHPYFTYDYNFDFGALADLGYLRSQAAVTWPGDRWLLAANVQYHQSLIASKDTGVDKGPVVEAPTVYFSRANTQLLSSLVSLELDSRFSNFYRASPFDPVPPGLFLSGSNLDTAPRDVVGARDYVRTGQRLQVEPRLVLNVPMPSGFQLQPVIQGGSTLYHFYAPGARDVHREYLQGEIPLSLYLSRTFNTGIEGFEQINHVIQPRVVYGASAYQTPEPKDHPFFYHDRPTGFTEPNPVYLSNPRFDIYDYLEPYEYFRLELINRFRRRSSTGAVSRFFRFQVSEQYNSRLSTLDPRYQQHYGPLEFLSEVSIGQFTGQLQANYQLSPTTIYNGKPLPAPVRESDLSGTLSYGPAYNFITLGALFRTRADPNLDAKTVNLRFYKVLPFAFDLEGALEYSFLPPPSRGFRSYSVGFHFHAKPRSCWEVVFSTGRDSNLHQFAFLDFRLNFGAAFLLNRL